MRKKETALFDKEIRQMYGMSAKEWLYIEKKKVRTSKKQVKTKEIVETVK